ncbi:MAG: tRNA lysidine(34) synthetase TilS, partial [Parachlamydia sp.]|nr:tRNA lysidine(34) synthetase TilS [Parachlamydia sp.]
PLLSSLLRILSFYLLLEIKKPFEVAHVNHRWREESDSEADALRRLAALHGIIYHEAVLNPAELKGNLEEACRNERLNFFYSLFKTGRYEGVLLAHQRDDQIETVLKRVMEGSHWMHLGGLKKDSIVNGVRLLRPFLTIYKKELLAYLHARNYTYFIDATNTDPHYLRARMRLSLLPDLNEKFGKKVDQALFALSQEMDEVNDYFNRLNADLLEEGRKGFLGTYWDLTEKKMHPAALKHFIRLLLKKEGLSLSREQIERISNALIMKQSNLQFPSGQRKIWVDRGKIFLVEAEPSPWETLVPLKEGIQTISQWTVKVTREFFNPICSFGGFNEAWQGQIKVQLPINHYFISPQRLNLSLIHSNKTLGEWFNNQKVPAFVRHLFPVLLLHEKIAHEFLSGRRPAGLIEGKECLQVEIIKLILKDSP